MYLNPPSSLDEVSEELSAKNAGDGFSKDLQKVLLQLHLTNLEDLVHIQTGKVQYPMLLAMLQCQ